MKPTAPESAAWARIAASPMVREQQVAFTCATGVPLALMPASATVEKRKPGAFCVKGCLGDHSGKVCERKLKQAEKRATTRFGPVQYACSSGLVKIPVQSLADEPCAAHRRLDQQIHSSNDELSNPNDKT